MPVEIPVFSREPLYKERVRLEGKDYVLRFDWNARVGRWFLSILDVNEKVLIAGMRLVANWPLLSRHHHNASLPPGELIAVDEETNGVPAGFEDIGRRVRLFYFASTEDIKTLAGQ